MVTQRQCKALTKAGAPCRMPPRVDSDYCWNHDRSVMTERAEARRRGGHNRRRRTGACPTSCDLRDIPAVQALLERAVSDTLAQENSIARNRSLGYLASLAMRAIESRLLEERVEAVEEQLAAFSAGAS